MVLIALLWIPVIQGSRGLYEYLQGIQAYLAPPIAAVFFFGVFNKRLNAAGCLAALRRRIRARAFLRLVVDTPVTLGLAGFEEGYTTGSWLWILNNIYFQYYSVLIFVVSVRRAHRRQLRDTAAARAPADGPDLCHGHRRPAAGVARAAGISGM